MADKIYPGGYVNDGAATPEGEQLTLGQLIARRRQVKGLSQRQLASMVGATQAAVSYWETASTIPHRKIHLLCEALGFSLSELKPDEETRPCRDCPLKKAEAA